MGENGEEGVTLIPKSFFAKRVIFCCKFAYAPPPRSQASQKKILELAIGEKRIENGGVVLLPIIIFAKRVIFC